MDTAFQKRLKSALGSKFVSSDADDGDLMVQTRFLYKSTRPHVDMFPHDEAVRNMGIDEAVQDYVAFVLLTDNDEAEFHSSGVAIPTVAGRLVTFPGSATHITTLKQGNVHLLGPFSVKTFVDVGGRYTHCEDAGRPNKRCCPACIPLVRSLAD